jgi:uncharacterized protein (TIGR00369 family)
LHGPKRYSGGPKLSAIVTPIIDEPVRGFVPDESFLSLPGIDRMRALMDGRLPPSPMQHLTGVRAVQVGHGSCTAVMPASPWFQTQAGFFVSGVTALVADFALGGAILSALPPWTFPVTSDINFTFLRPVRIDAGKIIARGRLIDSGRTQATSEGLIEDGNGRILAHATTRCFLRDIEPQSVTFQYPEPQSYDSPDPYDRPIPHDLAAPDDLSDLTGLEIARMISRGALPAPFMMLTGMFLNFHVEAGRIWTSFPATPWFQSPAGTIYGGLLCWITDLLSSAAATSTLEPRTATGGLDLKVHFLRPAVADGDVLTGEGEVVHGGKGLIVARSEVRNSERKPVVLAVASFMRRKIRDWVPIETSRDRNATGQTE